MDRGDATPAEIFGGGFVVDRRVRDGKLLRELPSEQREVRCLVYSADGQILASCGTSLKNEPDGSIYLWEALTGEHAVAFGSPRKCPAAALACKPR